MSSFRQIRNFRTRLLSFSSPPPLPTATASAATTLPSPPHLNSPTQSDLHMLSSFKSVDIESGIDTDDPPDWKRTGKVVQTVGLGGVGVCVTLIVNAPVAAKTHEALYTAYLTVVCLGLFTGMGLSFFSVVMKGSHAVGWVQKRLIFFTLFFVAVACFLRLHLALQLANIGIAMASMFAVVGFLVLYLWFGPRCERRWAEPGATPSVQV